MKNQYRLLLGSQSPRRKFLLEEAGFEFDIEVRPTDEIYDPGTPVEVVAEYLAKCKAVAFIGDLDQNQLLITADSVVVLDGKIYEKPKDRKDAIRILTELSGKTHTVYTGVYFMTTDKEVSITDATHVSFDKLTLSEIEHYIDNYSPYDKAGSYGVQDWLGLCKVCKIEGSYANVMGLPVHRVYQVLKEEFNY